MVFDGPFANDTILNTPRSSSSGAESVASCWAGTLFIGIAEHSFVRMSSERNSEEISEPAAKKQRTSSGKDAVDLVGPMENETTAKQKLEEAGFEEGNFFEEDLTSEYVIMTPMIHFCLHGDLKMCRFLLSKGASTTESTHDFMWFPIVAAASEGHIDVLEWLCNHGAKQDIQKLDDGDRTTLKYIAQNNHALEEDKRRATLKWLILNGALEERPGEISYYLVERDMGFCGRDDRRSLLSWAEEAVNTYQSFQVFLMGTLCQSAYSLSNLQKVLSTRLKSDDVASILVSNRPPEVLQVCWQKLQRPPSANSCLNGQPGILQQISEFAGVVRGRDLRIKEQFAQKLKLFIMDVPVEDYGYDFVSDSDSE